MTIGNLDRRSRAWLVAGAALLIPAAAWRFGLFAGSDADRFPPPKPFPSPRTGWNRCASRRPPFRVRKGGSAMRRRSWPRAKKASSRPTPRPRRRPSCWSSCRASPSQRHRSARRRAHGRSGGERRLRRSQRRGGLRLRHRSTGEPVWRGWPTSRRSWPPTSSASTAATTRTRNIQVHLFGGCAGGAQTVAREERGAGSVNRKLWIVLNLALAGAVVWTTIEFGTGGAPPRRIRPRPWAAPWAAPPTAPWQPLAQPAGGAAVAYKEVAQKDLLDARAIPTFRSRRLRCPRLPRRCRRYRLSRIHEYR